MNATFFVLSKLLAQGQEKTIVAPECSNAPVEGVLERDGVAMEIRIAKMVAMKPNWPVVSILFSSYIIISERQQSS